MHRYSHTERTAKDGLQVRKNTVDVLMVVDNSCSMFEEQDNLAWANFSSFISAFDGVDVDWQISHDHRHGGRHAVRASPWWRR